MHEYMVVPGWVYNQIRRLACKRVYRSGGKGRRKRVKWVNRS